MKGLVIALALALSGCGVADKVLESTPVVGAVCKAADRILIDEKVVYAANVLYNIPAQAYVSANNRGQLSAELKARLKPMLVNLYGYTQTIKAARGTVNCDFASMKKLHADVLALMPTE